VGPRTDLEISRKMIMMINVEEEIIMMIKTGK
jgi:hypothetical protein